MIETFRNKDDGSNSQKHDDSKQRVGRLEDILAAGTEQERVQEQQTEYIEEAADEQQKSIVVDEEIHEIEAAHAEDIDALYEAPQEVASVEETDEVDVDEENDASAAVEELDLIEEVQVTEAVNDTDALENANNAAEDVAMSKRTASKGRGKVIALLVLVVLLVAGIWVLKNNPFASEGTLSLGGLQNAEANADLALESGVMNPDELLEFKLPLFIDFGSDTCPPCVKMHPYLEQVHAEVEAKAIVKYLDTEQYQSIIMRYPIRVTPTQILIMPDGSPYKASELVRNAGLSFIEYGDQETKEHVLTVHEGYLDADDMMLILNDMIEQSA